MEVKRVQAPQTFSGYVDKPVKQYINKAVSNSMDKIIIRANEFNRPVEIIELQRLKDLGQKILEQLEKFMAESHPKTSVSLESAYGGNNTSLAFTFKNPLAPAKIDSWSLTGANRKIFRNEDVGERELCYLYRAVEELSEKVNPHNIDKEILRQSNEKIENMTIKATNFFKRLMLKYKVKSTKRFASEISEQPGDNIKYIDNLLMWARSSSKEKTGTNNQNKRIAKENWKAKKLVLKD